MRNDISIILVAVTVSVLLSACESFGEGAKGLYVPSYSEAANARKNFKPPSPEELARLTAGCPKPNGVFQNDAQEKGKGSLERHFLVPGFETPATSFPGGRADDLPLAASAFAINILGGVKNGVRQSYYPHPSERFTLELRPLGEGRFRIGVKSTLGLSGEAEGYLSLSGEGKRCENGSLKAYWKTPKETIFGWELYVEAGSGDIVIHSPGGQYYGGWHKESFTRFKRIGN